MLTTSDGTLLTSVFVRHFVGVSLNRQIIREWQLEQTDHDAFVFRYVALDQNGLNDNLEQLKASLKIALGKTATIQMQRVTEIPPTATGKVSWIVNRTQPKAFSAALNPQRMDALPPIRNNPFNRFA